jgi:alpha-galactosidase
MEWRVLCGLGIGAAVVGPAWAGDTVWLDTIQTNLAQMPWGRPQRNLAFGRTPISIGGKAYQVGLGVIASSKIWIDLGRGVKDFKAEVGADDAGGGRGVQFVIACDGRTLWKSGVMHKGDPAQAVNVDVSNKSYMLLAVEDADGQYYGDKADWANARWDTYWSEPDQASSELNPAVVLTPPTPRKPHLNSALRYGVRPNSPFEYTIPCTGRPPLRFLAEGLPAGLTLDPTKGRIQGRLAKAGVFHVKVSATNSLGSDTKAMDIVVGNAIALTPPMGWSSWNAWCTSPSQARILAAAHAFVDTRLIDHGFTYVNVDDGWQGPRGGKLNGIQPNEKFPDIHSAIAEIHRLGLKFGVYSGPWINSYSGYTGGSSDDPTGKWTPDLRKLPNDGHTVGKYSFATNDAQEWASWGVDFLKYDWYPNDEKEVARMSRALRSTGRDIVYSISNSAHIEQGPMLEKFAQLWRDSGDIRDNWSSLYSNGFRSEGWEKFAGPGHWPDPDMMVLGNVGFGSQGWGTTTHPTGLTPDEQYSHMSLWCLLAAPLILGCDLTKLDPFTMGLLTNDEVIAIDQDPLGASAKKVGGDYFHEIWAKPLSDGSLAVGIFNVGPGHAKYDVPLTNLGIAGRFQVRDIWRQKNYPAGTTDVQETINGHGVLLLKLSPKPGGA